MKNIVLHLSLAGLILGMGFLEPELYKKENYSTLQFKKDHLIQGQALPLYFFTSIHCKNCHGHDKKFYALYTEDGEDVNLIDDWAGSMMANSFNDPFWRAKIKDETLELPHLKTEIESKCLNCHAPMAKYQKLYSFGTDLTFDEALSDTLAHDGVSCIACHGMKPDSLFIDPGGQLHFLTDSTVFGPYEEPFGATMTQYSGLEPLYGKHMLSSSLCGKCHTLITDILDSDGLKTGKVFYEQTMYQEWLNSKYVQENISCQKCHIPEANGPVPIASGVNGLDPREPFGQHHLAGANLFMLQMMKNNISLLNISASKANFDSTIAATNVMLKEKSIDLSLKNIGVKNDTLNVEVSIINKAGHKFPSGYPSRRAFIQLSVINLTNNALEFQSGKLDQYGNLIEDLNDYEPHYHSISKADQTQIYEMVMGDFDGKQTTVLSRAAVVLKDNRLVPQGWKNDHFTKDTVSIIGDARDDESFNINNGVEGSGGDKTTFKIPVHSSRYKIKAKIFYQAIPHKWVQHMFLKDEPSINLFKNLYDTAQHKSVLVKEDSLEITIIDNHYIEYISTITFQNPVLTHSQMKFFNVPNKVNNIKIVDLFGKEAILHSMNNGLMAPTPNIPGTYFVMWQQDGVQFSRPLIVL